MTVSISKMSVEYYLEQVAIGDAAIAGSGTRDLTRYYTSAGAPPGRWLGAGTAGLGIASGTRVTARAARRLLQDSAHPTTGEPLGRAPITAQQAPEGANTAAGKPAKSDRQPVAGFDLTFSVPKSVSVLWAMADEPTKAAIHAAHRAAVDQSLSWLDDRVIQTRAGHAGVAKVAARGLVATAFDHWDSRAGDPQLHTHVVVANRIQRASDGAWTTLDSVSLHKNVVAASERFNGLLFDELARTVGAQAEIRGETTTSADGLQLTDRNARIELAGVPDELINEFSTRARAIEAEADRLIAAWTKEHGARPSEGDLLDIRRQATLATREAKDHDDHRSLERKSAQWRDRASDLGFDPAAVVSRTVAQQPSITTAETVQPDTMTQIARRAITTVSAQRATFTRANVHAEISRCLAAVRCHTPEDRDQLLDAVTDLALDSTVRLTPHRYQSSDQHHPGLSSGTDHAFNDTASYATSEQLDAEARLIDAATNDQGPVISDIARAEAVLDSITVGDGRSLAADQRRAALSIATGPQSISALIGPAGTGKTTSLSALRQVWEDQHGAGSIVGLAPSAVAASVLSKEIDVPTDNVSKWLWESTGPGAQHRQEQLDQARDEMTRLLAHLDDSPSAAQQRTMRRLNATITQLETAQDRYTMRPNQLVIVDEASMAGTQALDQLRDQAQHAGAKIVAVGDPAQLSAIEAGGTLGWIERHQDRPDVTAATLTSVWRFKNDWEACNSLALREGKHHAIDTLIDHDRITGVADPDDVETTAFQQWAEARTQGSALLIASTTESVDRLNAQAQALLRSEGEVDGTHTADLSAGAVAGVGDRILTRRNERQVLDDQGEFIKNGDLLTVTRVYADGALEAIRDNGAAVHLPPEVLATTQLGYACTAHRSQGATVDRAITAVDPSSTSRETFYVGLTRGRYSNTAVVPIPDSDAQDTQTDTPDPWKMIREITPQTVRDQLVRVLDRSDTDMTAHEVRDHAHGWDADLPRLTDELRYAGQAIATRQAVEWIEGSHGPETVTSWANSEHWHAIINEIARGHRVPDDQAPETPREALAAVKTADLQPRPTLHGGLAVPTSDNDAETHTVRQVLDKISDRLTVLRAQTHDEPWRSALATEPTQRIDAALIARQLCDWDDPDTVLPDAPPQDRRAAEAWHHFHDSATQPTQTTTPEPTPVPDDQPRVHPESPEVIHTTTGPEGTHL